MGGGMWGCSLFTFRRWLVLFWMGGLLFSSAGFALTGLSLQLVSEQSAVVPGKPFTVGLWVDHDRGWHTYWRQPGIVGVPTHLTWSLPRGWRAGPLVFPEPERTLMFQIKAQGFDRDVMLRTEITPPADLKPGEQVTLEAQAVWMCCGKSCHPGSVDLKLTLPVAETAVVVEKWRRLLDAERARAERTSTAWTATAQEKADSITLTLKPASGAARVTRHQRDAEEIIVFTEDGWFDSDQPQIITRHADGALSIQLKRAETYLGGKPPRTLRCILRCEKGWEQGQEWRCLQIAPRIER